MKRFLLLFVLLAMCCFASGQSGPQAEFDFSFSQRQYCSFIVDTYISFEPDITIPAGDSLLSITWNYGDGKSDVYYNMTFPNHDYLAGGTYTAVMDVRLKSGYKKTISKVVNVQQPLDWNVEIRDDSVTTPGVHILTPINVRPAGVGNKIRWWAQPRRIESFVKPIGDTIQAILPGLYVAHLIDSCGGIWTHDTVEVRDPFTSEWRASIRTFVTSGCWDTTILSVNTNAPKGAYRVLWNTGETTDTIIATRQGRYSFTFTDNIGKKRKDSADVTVYPRDVATLEVYTKDGSDTLVAAPYDRNSLYFFYRNDTLLPSSELNYNKLNSVRIPGIYKVKIQNSRGCSVTSLPLYYKVAKDTVALNFNYTSDKCIGQQLKFTGTAVPSNNLDTVKSVKWNFGDGTTATYPGGNNTVTHYYEAAGAYVVSLTATTIAGHTFSMSKQVTVQQGVDYSVKITKDDDAPDNMRILRAIKNPANGFITWSNGSTKDTIHVYTSGQYSVRMKDSCGNVRSADSVYIGIEDKWTVKASVARWTTCGDTAILLASVTPLGEGYTITWSNGAKSDITYATKPGVYYVVVKDSDGEISSTDSVTVYLKQFKANLELHRAATPGNDTLIVSPNNPSDTGNYYRWYKDGVQFMSGSSPILNKPISGLYQVYAFNKAGCLAKTDTIRCVAVPEDTIGIGNGPIEGGKILPVTAGFVHDFNADNVFTVQLTLQNPGGRETGIRQDEVINLGSLPGTDKNVAMQVDIPDTLACATSYAVRVVASSPADTTAWSQLFTITNQPPQPTITQRGDSLFTSGNYNWQWYFNDKAIEGATSASYRARANGSYMVESRNGNDCNSKSSPVSVIITAVGEVTLGGNKVKAFPNPSEGQVSLQFEKPLLKAVTINVYNMNGRVMYTRTTTQQLQPLDLSGLLKGYYLIELTGYGQKKVLSLILQ